MTQFCKECGEPIEAPTRFCTSCGAIIEQQKGLVPAKPTQSEPIKQHEQQTERTKEATNDMPAVPTAEPSRTKQTSEPLQTKQRSNKKGSKIAIILSLIVVIVLGGSYAALHTMTAPNKKISAFTEALTNKDDQLFSLVVFPEQTFYDKTQFFKELDDVVDVKKLQPKMEKAAKQALETNTSITVVTEDDVPFVRIVPTTDYALFNTVDMELVTTKLELTTNEKKTKIQLGSDSVAISSKPVIIGRFVRGTYNIPVTIDGKTSEPLSVQVTGKERLQQETIAK